MSAGVDKDVKQYFGKESFKRLFLLFKNRIEFLEKVSGTVSFAANDEEKRAVEKWMGQSYAGNKITVSLIKFEKRLIGSKFEDFSLWEIVEMVTGSPIVFKKDKQEKEEVEKIRYFESLLGTFPHPYSELIIRKILDKEKGTQGLLSLYHNKDGKTLELLLKAVSNLPKDGDFERIPIFAERIAGDPHYFDKSKLYQVLELILSHEEERAYRSQLTSEEELDLLSVFGLAKDDLHSFVTCYGLEAFRGDNRIKQWHWANEERSIQNIPLRSIKNIDRVKPVQGNVVFVVENSGVYSSIMDQIQDDVYPVICTHGNFKLSGLLLLDKLVKNDTQIYYSGDIDVNGLMIAQYLKEKHGESVHFWRMGIQEYEWSLSSVKQSKGALERLNGLKDVELRQVANRMKEIKFAAYQEPLIKYFVKDIINNK